MGTINSVLSVMTGALDADQEALNVVANNVANANTKGYTEETPDWKENAPISVGGVLVGDGVTETGATSELRLLLIAGKRSDGQRAARAGVVVGVDAGRRHFQCGEQPERTERGHRPGSVGGGEPGEFADWRNCATEPCDRVFLSQCGCGNAGGSAAAGPEPALAIGRNQPGDDGEQRIVGDDNLGAVAGFGGAELPTDDRNSKRSYGLLSGRNRHYFAIGIWRRATGRVFNGAGRGHSRRGEFARPTGV